MEDQSNAEIEFRSEKDFIQLRSYLIDDLNKTYGQLDHDYNDVTVITESFNVDFTAALKVRSMWVEYARDMALHLILREYNNRKNKM